MIVRIWRGWVSPEDGDAYADYMQETALPGYARIAGNKGLYMLRRRDGNREEFCMVTVWDSVEAIREFAGPDYEDAVFYPRDEDFLIDREWTVRHYDVYGTVIPGAPDSA